MARRRTEQRIDRRAEVILFGPFRHPHPILDDQEVSIGNGDVDLPGLQSLAIGCVDSGKRAGTAQYFSQQALVARRYVQNHKNRRREISRKARNDFLQRSHAAC